MAAQLTTGTGVVLVEMLRTIERRCRLELNWYGHREALTDLLARATAGPDDFLCALDLVLHTLAREDDAEELEDMLEEAGSAWRVAVRDMGSSVVFVLERRVDEVVQAAAEMDMTGQDPAARLLRDAWHEMYGRSPNVSDAYRDAVRAVEAAAQPILTPDDDRATLGKMIAAVRDAPEKWAMVIPAGDGSGIETMRRMMETLWKGAA